MAAGPQHADRAWSAVPWVEECTVVQALDGQGRVVAAEELLLGVPDGG